MSTDTALERDTQYLVDKNLNHVNPEQFSNVVDRFFDDGYSEDQARSLALEVIKNN